MSATVVKDWLEENGISSGDIAAMETSNLLSSVGLFQTVTDTALNEILKEANVTLAARAKVLAGLKGIRRQISVVQGDNLKIVQAMADSAQGLIYWLKATILATIFAVVPVLAIVINHTNYDYEIDPATGEPVPLEVKKLREIVIAPGIAVFFLFLAASPMTAMFFARDMLQERSAGFDAKLQAKDSLMNSGLVCALLLTMVISALQADSPTPEPTTILSMYYTVSLNMSLYFSMSATGISALCLVYIQPLEGAAAERFMSTMALYFGEPYCNMVFSLMTLVVSMNLWVWGKYGDSAGTVALFLTWFLETRTFVTLQNLSAWKNEEITDDERKGRIQIVTEAERQEAQAHAPQPKGLEM